MASATRKRHPDPAIATTFLWALISNLLLVIIPLPIGPMRRQMVGTERRRKSGRDTILYSHPDIVCTAHLIWVGWVVAGAGVFNMYVDNPNWQMPIESLCWLWLATLILTIAMMGLRFSSVACGYLAAAVLLIFVLTLLLRQNITDFPGQFFNAFGEIPVDIAWGVPLTVSVVLGVLFAAVAAWQTLHEVWVLPYDEDYLEQRQFLRRAWSRSLGGLQFEASTPCVLRRMILFGYGDIIIRLLNGTEVARVSGVFFAEHNAELMRRRMISSRDGGSAQSEDEQVALEAGSYDDMPLTLQQEVE